MKPEFKYIKFIKWNKKKQAIFEEAKISDILLAMPLVTIMQRVCGIEPICLVKCKYLPDDTNKENK